MKIWFQNRRYTLKRQMTLQAAADARPAPAVRVQPITCDAEPEVGAAYTVTSRLTEAVDSPACCRLAAAAPRPPASLHCAQPVPALGHVFPAAAYSGPGSGLLVDYAPTSAAYDDLPPFEKASVDPESSVYLHGLGGSMDDGPWLMGEGGCYSYAGVGQFAGFTHYIQEPYALGVQSW